MTDYLPPSIRLRDVRAVISATARMYEITEEDILGDRRSPRYSAPRHVAMHIVAEVCGLSLREVGQVFRRDHTSVNNAARRIRTAIETQPLMAEVINQIVEEAHGRIGQ